MERLTVRGRKGQAYFDEDGLLIRGANGTFHLKKDMTAHFIHQKFVALDKVIDRLAAYEDTGLTPEEVMELVQAKKDGRLIMLPCGNAITLRHKDGHDYRADHWNMPTLTGFRDADTPSGQKVRLFSIEDVKEALAAWEGEHNETDTV